MATFIPLSFFNPQFVDGNGAPLDGGTISFFLEGTTTATNVFSNITGTILGSVITLDSNGRSATFMFRDDSIDMKYELKNAAGTSIETPDQLRTNFSNFLATNSKLAGTNSAPAITLGDGSTNDSDTGFYHSADNEWSFSGAGTQLMTMTATALSFQVAGSAATPVLSFSGDNTGWFRSAEDEQAFSANGSLLLTLQAAGMTLHGGIATFSRADSTPAGTAATTNDDGVFGSTDTTNTGITIFGSGQVGINFGDAADNNVGQIRYQHSTNDLEIFTNATKRWTLGSLGEILQTSTATTGNAHRITADSLTTGSEFYVYSNSSDTGTRNQIEVINDNTAATGVTPIKVQQDAVVSTNFKRLMNIAGFTIYISDGTTAEGALTGVVGDLCLNGSTANGGCAFCDANGTNWTDM